MPSVETGRALLAERFGPTAGLIVVDDQASAADNARRIRAIAAIHAVADYLAAHPELPTPNYMQLHGSCSDSELIDLANAYDTPLYGHPAQAGIDLPVPNLRAVLLAYVPRPDRPL